MPRAKPQPCTILAIDPGETTGVVTLTLDPRWLSGAGPPTWEGLGGAVRHRYGVEIGRHPKAWNEDSARSRTSTNERLEALHIPITPQPLESDADPGVRFFTILNGLGPAGGGDISTVTYNEIRQLRQVAGLLEIHPSAALVIEGFTLRTQSKDTVALSPDRLRLAIEANEVMHGSRGRLPFVQQPGYAMSTATNERLLKARLNFPGLVHATDAMRHAATFARDLRKDADLRAAAFPLHFKKESN